MKKNNFGFTLIELMITVTILGIIAAIAIPNYQKTVRISNRADAKTAINTVSNELARFNVANRSYTTDMTKFSLPSATTGSALSDSGHYRVTIAAGTGGIAKSYTISATQETNSQKLDTDCKTFSMTSAGLKSSINKANTDSTAKCW